ncbi:MAG: hypothetical protein ACTH2Q_15220 [Propionibacteriaceae bacterium]
MTTTVAEPTRSAASSTGSRPVLFGRAVAFEWTKLIGVRATVVNALLALLGTVGLGLLFGGSVRASGENGLAERTTAAALAFQPLIVTQALVIAIVTLSVTSEYASGSIRTTLQAVPRRGRMLLAKVVVGIGVGVVAGLVLTPISSVSAALLAGDWAPLNAGEVATVTVGTAAFLGLLGVLVVGLSMALRSTAGSLVSLFVLIYVVPQVLPAFGVEWLTKANDYLPFTAFAVLGTGGSEPYGWPIALLVMGAWAAAAVVVGGLLLQRRDSN